MIRREAVMDFSITKHLFTEEKYTVLNEMIHNSEFMERILISSHSLYNQLINIIEKKKNIDHKTEKALIKYIIRMASRPQPYGLSAGIYIDSKEKLIKDSYIKEVLISLEWRIKIGKLAERSLSVSSKITLIANPTLYKNENQYSLEVNKGIKNEYIYIKATPFLDDLLDFLKAPKKLDDIINRYSEKRSNEQILEVVKQLLNRGVIKSNITSSSINLKNDDFFKHLERLLPENSELKEKLTQIYKLYEEYRCSKIGKGIDIYINLIDAMSSLCPSKRYVTVNLYYVDKEKARENKPKIFEQDFEIMNFFDNELLYDWKTYLSSFLGKYGQYIKVPLLKMLDPDLGLGLPPINKQGNFNKSIEKYIINRILQTINSNNNVLGLNSEDYNYLKDTYIKNKEFEKIPISFDCKIIPFQTKVIIPPNAFSFPRYSFTGRFSFGTQKKIIKEDGNAELNYISSNFPDVGITYKSESTYFIDCVGDTTNSNKRVPLNEIYVIVLNNKFHLIHNNKIIYPVFTQLLEYRNFNEHPAVIFLQDFSRYIFEHPSTFPIKSFDYLEFIPRIEYKNLILSPARINIAVNKNLSIEEKSQIVREKIDKYKFNNLEYVHFLEGDKYLPVPINNDYSIKLLGNSFFYNGEEDRLILIEAPEITNNTKKIYDFIFSSLNSPTVKYKGLEIADLKLSSDLPEFENIIDYEWTSFNLYYRKGKRLKVENCISMFFKKDPNVDFFLVNYKELNNKEHIRLRYKKNSELDKKIGSFLTDLISGGDLYNFEITLFYPEVGRYGGKDVSQLVYKLFSINSRAIQILRINYHIYDKFEAALYLTSYTFYELLHGEKKLLKEYLNEMYPKDSNFVKLFSKQRSRYCSIVLKAIEDYKENNNALLFEKKILARTILDTLYNKNLNGYQISYLLKSIIHMEINRHFPFDRALENKATQFMRFSFSNLIYILNDDGADIIYE